MKLSTIRNKRDARELARLHQRLAEAHVALGQAITSPNGEQGSTITGDSRDRIYRTMRSIAEAIQSLENPFCDAAGGGMDVPMANPNDPLHWVKWLERNRVPDDQEEDCVF